MMTSHRVARRLCLCRRHRGLVSERPCSTRPAPGAPARYAGGELLEMAAAASLLLGCHSYARALLAGRQRRGAGPPRATLPSLAALSAGWTRVKLAIGAVAGVFAAGRDGLHLARRWTTCACSTSTRSRLRLPRSRASLLLGARRDGAAATASSAAETCARRRWWLALAFVFVFLGLDEMAALHEAVQDRVHGSGARPSCCRSSWSVSAAWWTTLQELRTNQRRGACCGSPARPRGSSPRASTLVLNERLRLDDRSRGAGRDDRLAAVRALACSSRCGRWWPTAVPPRSAWPRARRRQQRAAARTVSATRREPPAPVAPYAAAMTRRWTLLVLVCRGGRRARRRRGRALGRRRRQLESGVAAARRVAGLRLQAFGHGSGPSGDGADGEQRVAAGGRADRALQARPRALPRRRVRRGHARGVRRATTAPPTGASTRSRAPPRATTTGPTTTRATTPTGRRRTPGPDQPALLPLQDRRLGVHQPQLRVGARSRLAAAQLAEGAGAGQARERAGSPSGTGRS